MPERRDQLRAEIGALMRLMAVLKSTATADEWEDVELTVPQMRALDLLAGEPLRMTSLATALNISLPATTSMIDRLTQKGFVERTSDPSDRRVVLCDLTPAGRRALERFFQLRQSRFDALIGELSDDELATVVAGFAVLAAAGERMLAQMQGAVLVDD